MRKRSFWIAACLLPEIQYSLATPVPQLQVPLEGGRAAHPQHQIPSPRLRGRFLHITDIHPDPYYKLHASTEEEDACHRGNGTSGTYGAETTDCDSPFALVNETFKWIEQNLRDQIDFVIWTGDSARHDNDEKIPRQEDEVLNTNRYVAQKFRDTFSGGDDPQSSWSIPVIPTFGNNDILPHNILLSGPNKWLKVYTDVWSHFIPEEQRHGFERGGWFYVEAIPKKLAVFSLNTLYFFNNNAAVDGCALRSEPGFEHMEWLRIQLQFIRERGMKAILTGHVPPARTDSKQLWDETCWQKYTLWLQQYRDVIVGGFYGHMNIDHFAIHDTKNIAIAALDELHGADFNTREDLDDELSIKSASDYLQELRDDWSNLPNPSPAVKDLDLEFDGDDDVSSEGKKKKGKHGKKGKKGKKKKKKKNPFKKVGGPWAERFQVTHIGPSVVPNYFPTLRIVEYNISGLEDTAIWSSNLASPRAPGVEETVEAQSLEDYLIDHLVDEFGGDDEEVLGKKRKKHKKKKKPQKPKDPNLIIPQPPAKTAPPGPAYSPQTLALLGYVQYYANLTRINNEHFIKPDEDGDDDVEGERWHKGKHHGKHPEDKNPKPKKIKYEVEYSTFNDSIYALEDLTVKSYVELARRIGQYKAEKGDKLLDPQEYEEEDVEEDEDEVDEDINEETDEAEDVDTEGKKGKKKHGKKKKKRSRRKQREKNQPWLHFLQRAFVGTVDEEDLVSLSHEYHDFEQDSASSRWNEEQDATLFVAHDGEL